MTPITKMLILNEWRRQQSMVLMLSALTVFSWLCSYLLLSWRIQELLVTQVAGAMMLGLPILFCFVLADTFTHEFDRKTTPFLQGLPVSPSQIFRVKYLYSLTVFLLLSIFALSLLKTQVDTDAVFMFKGSSGEDFALVKCLIVISFPLLHSAVFFFAMVGRNSGNSVITILMLPLILLLSLPWLALLIIFLPRVDGTAFLLFLLIDGVIFTIVFIELGYLLWTRYMSCGLSIKKPLWIAAAVTIFSPLLIFISVYGWTSIELELAFRAAEKAGMVLSFRQLQSTDSSMNTDVTAELKNFTAAFDQNIKEGKPYYKFFSQKHYKGHSLSVSSIADVNLGFGLTREEQQAGADSLLQNPQMIELNAMLETIAARINPYLRNSAAGSTEYHESWQNIRHLEPAICFLRARGTACRIVNRPAEMYKCWMTVLKLKSIIEKERFGWTGFFQMRMTQAIAQAIIANAGNEPEFKGIANEMIRQLDKVDLTAGGEDFCLFPESWKNDKAKLIDASLLYYPYAWFAPSLRELPPWHSVLRVLALPRAQHLLTGYMNFSTDSYILSRKIREFPPFETIRKEHDALYEQHSRENGSWEIKQRKTLITWFYSYHNHISMNKLALALLIYRREHGSFPATLQELSPEILPKVPTAAFTGKAFDYRRTDNGFSISTDDAPGTPWDVPAAKMIYPLTVEEGK